MVAACKDAGVKLGVAFHNRWHAGLRKLHGEVADGKLGELRHMRVQWSFHAPDDANWRAGTDVGKWWGLAGVGTHCLDQILWFLEPACGEVVELKSIITRDVWKGPNDETALISMKFASRTAPLRTFVRPCCSRRRPLRAVRLERVCHGRGCRRDDGRRQDGPSRERRSLRRTIPISSRSRISQPPCRRPRGGSRWAHGAAQHGHSGAGDRVIRGHAPTLRERDNEPAGMISCRFLMPWGLAGPLAGVRPGAARPRWRAGPQRQG